MLNRPEAGRPRHAFARQMARPHRCDNRLTLCDCRQRQVRHADKAAHMACSCRFDRQRHFQPFGVVGAKHRHRHQVHT